MRLPQRNSGCRHLILKEVALCLALCSDFFRQCAVPTWVRRHYLARRSVVTRGRSEGASPFMKVRGIRIYVGLMCVAAVAGLVLTPWSSLIDLPASNQAALVGRAVMALLFESVAIRLSVGEKIGSASVHRVHSGPRRCSVIRSRHRHCTRHDHDGSFGEFVVRRKGLQQGAFRNLSTTMGHSTGLIREAMSCVVREGMGGLMKTASGSGLGFGTPLTKRSG